MNDAATGRDSAILDGGPITAHRTAAVSGVVIGHFAGRRPGGPGGTDRVGCPGPQPPAGPRPRAAGLALTLFDRHPERAEALAVAARETDGIGEVSLAPDARAAVRDADVVVTAASFGPVRQVMTAEWLAAGALVVPVDYATYLAAEVARDAALFLVDDRGQFLTNRDAGLFDGYPDPTATIGEALLGGAMPAAAGRVVVTHLGVGLADVVFGAAIVRRAEGLGLGTMLPR